MLERVYPKPLSKFYRFSTFLFNTPREFYTVFPQKKDPPKQVPEVPEMKASEFAVICVPELLRGHTAGLLECIGKSTLR